MDNADASDNASNFSKCQVSRFMDWKYFLGHQGEKESKSHLPLRKEVLHWLFGLLHWLLEVLLGLFGLLLWLFGSLHWLLEVLLGLLELLAGFPKERVLDMRGR